MQSVLKLSMRLSAEPLPDPGMDLSFTADTRQSVIFRVNRHPFLATNRRPSNLQLSTLLCHRKCQPAKALSTGDFVAPAPVLAMRLKMDALFLADYIDLEPIFGLAYKIHGWIIGMEMCFGPALHLTVAKRDGNMLGHCAAAGAYAGTSTSACPSGEQMRFPGWRH